MPVTNLPFIQQQMIRYGMSVYLALGLVGNICNCIMFMQRTHRHTASFIYFLFFSIFAIIYLIWSITPYLYTLNHIDPATQSLLYCKVKLYGTHVLGQYIRFLIVFACADRFFATRISVRIRSLTSVSMAIKLVTVMCVVCPLIAIHLPIETTIRGGVCGMFGLYKIIYPVYQTIIIGIVPPVLMATFSILTVRSLHQRHGAQRQARQRDRYLMRMVTAEVVVNIVTSIPYSITFIYGGATYYVNKSLQRLEIEAFILFLANFLVYLISVAPFYLFLSTSKPFRNEFFTIIVNSWKKYILRRVRIVPVIDQNNTITNAGQMTKSRQ